MQCLRDDTVNVDVGRKLQVEGGIVVLGEVDSDADRDVGEACFEGLLQEDLLVLPVTAMPKGINAPSANAAW